MQKRVLVSIKEELIPRWSKVAKKHGITKSSMVEEYLEKILPILEAETPSKIMAKAMKQLSDEIDTTATLFDNMIHDQSIEDYKEMKRG